MRIAVCGDVHVCKNSSIIKGRGERYSQRLENCIASVNWFEKFSQDMNCDMNVYLGDFFDSPLLDDETLTAINEIRFREDCTRFFVVGNHESSVNGLYYNSVASLNKTKQTRIISKPTSFLVGNISFDFIPYILDSDRKQLSTYIENKNFRHIIFSHNDIAGIQLGKFISKSGFTIDEIEQNCELFINGHLHNHSWVTDKIVNLGNITGQNFGEDATKYGHYAMILDVSNTGEIEASLHTNPYAFNFYKLDVEDFSKFTLTELKSNAVVSIKCYDKDVESIKRWLSENDVAESRITVKSGQEPNKSSLTDGTNKLSIDHIAKFIEACVDKFGHSDILQEELEEIVGLV